MRSYAQPLFSRAIRTTRLLLPAQPQAGPDTADVWSHRTSWRRAFDTRPRWCRVWRHRRPLGVLFVPGVSRSRRVARSGSLNRNLDGRFALTIRFSAVRYSFCGRSSWFTYARSRAHVLFLMATAYHTLRRAVWYFDHTGTIDASIRAGRVGERSPPASRSACDRPWEWFRARG